MNDSIPREILALKKSSLTELQARYSELFGGKKSPSNNMTHLWQRIAYRIQEIKYEGLPEEQKIRPRSWLKNMIL